MAANRLRFAFFAMLVCLVLVVASIFIAQDPPHRPIISGPHSLAYDIVRTQDEHGSNATYRAADENFVFIIRVVYNGEDVTEIFGRQARELVELLAATMSRRDRVFGTFLTGDVLWEIDLIHGGRPIHILLSREDATEELNFWYGDASRPMYRIVEPEVLVEALRRMLESL